MVGGPKIRKNVKPVTVKEVSFRVKTNLSAAEVQRRLVPRVEELLRALELHRCRKLKVEDLGRR